MALVVHIDSLCQSVGEEAAIEWRERRLKLLRKTGVTAVNQATPLYLIVKNSGGDMLKTTENYFTMQKFQILNFMASLSLTDLIQTKC